MARASSSTPTDISFYEGLCRKTASLYVGFVQEDYDDIVQVLRITVWRANVSYDRSRSKMTRERYIFMCVKNRCKDLVRKRHRPEVFLEDLAPHEDSPVEWMLQLATSHEQTFGDVEDELTMPSTLTATERHIIGLLYADRTQKETAAALGLTRAEMERAVKVIRQKMADWRPGPSALPAAMPAAA